MNVNNSVNYFKPMNVERFACMNSLAFKVLKCLFIANISKSNELRRTLSRQIIYNRLCVPCMSSSHTC